jgi:hypothetical protein
MTTRTKVGLGLLAATLLGLGLAVRAMIVLPPADPAKTVEGRPAPPLSLASTAGGTSSLQALLAGRTAAVLVFYRGDW